MKNTQRNKFIDDCQYIGKNGTLYIKINGYDCKIKRHSWGHLCGYVILEDEIFLYDNTLSLLDVHGGITYNEVESIDGELKTVIGFDCAHGEDYIPYGYEPGTATYKDLKFVKKELVKLIKQLEKLGIK